MGSELPISRSEYYRRETEILFGIELLLHRWRLSTFVFDEDEQVFRDRDGMMVLSCHYADRSKMFGSR